MLSINLFLQSKTEGLMILSKEVEALRTELNQTKVLNEHLINPVSVYNCVPCNEICVFKEKQWRATAGGEHNDAVWGVRWVLHLLCQGEK